MGNGPARLQEMWKAPSLPAATTPIWGTLRCLQRSNQGQQADPAGPCPSCSQLTPAKQCEITPRMALEDPCQRPSKPGLAATAPAPPVGLWIPAQGISSHNYFIGIDPTRKKSLLYPLQTPRTIEKCYRRHRKPYGPSEPQPNRKRIKLKCTWRILFPAIPFITANSLVLQETFTTVYCKDVSLIWIQK